MIDLIVQTDKKTCTKIQILTAVRCTVDFLQTSHRLRLNPLFLNNQRSECVRMKCNVQVTMWTFTDTRRSWYKSSSTQLVMADTSTIAHLRPKNEEFGVSFSQ
jgi:hypothetical protein